MRVETQPVVDRLVDAVNRAGLACRKDGSFRVAMIDAEHLRSAIAVIDRLERENLALRADVAEAKVRDNRRQHDADIERRAYEHVMHIERGGVE